ncbi:Unknown protein, partial [Striga hermonthica]
SFYDQSYKGCRKKLSDGRRKADRSACPHITCARHGRQSQRACRQRPHAQQYVRVASAPQSVMHCRSHVRGRTQCTPTRTAVRIQPFAYTAASHAQQRSPQRPYARKQRSTHAGQCPRTPARPTACQQCPVGLGVARQHARVPSQPSTHNPRASRLSVVRSSAQQCQSVPVPLSAYMT